MSDFDWSRDNGDVVLRAYGSIAVHENPYGGHSNRRSDRRVASVSMYGGTMRSIGTLLAMGLVLAVAACGDTPGQRAVTGGAVGAGTGAVVGSTVGHPVGGAVVGGLGGAAVGAATTPERRY